MIARLYIFFSVGGHEKGLNCKGILSHRITGAFSQSYKLLDGICIKTNIFNYCLKFECLWLVRFDQSMEKVKVPSIIRTRGCSGPHQVEWGLDGALAEEVRPLPHVHIWVWCVCLGWRKGR